MTLNWPWNVPVGLCQAREVAGIPQGANGRGLQGTACWGTSGHHAPSRPCVGPSDRGALRKVEADQP